VTAGARIDAHQHFWRLARGDYGWLTPDLAPLYRDYEPGDLRPLLEERGISRTVLVQAAPSDAETDFLLELADRHAGIGAVVGWVDLAAAGAPARLAVLAGHERFRGVRPMIQDIDDDVWMLRDALTPAIHALVELGLRFDALVLPRHLGHLAHLLDRHPGLPMVIDHGAKPDIAGGGLAPWRESMRPLAERPGVYCKLSGLVTEAASGWHVDDLRPYAEVLFELFGADRLMWGSDWPVVNLAGGYGAWWTATQALFAGRSVAERDAVLGGTAATFYGIRRIDDG
jgi:L-fuconolactonase